MPEMNKRFFVIITLGALLFLSAITPQQRRTLYSSLDPKSIRQHLAFYQLYPDSQEGQDALRTTQSLLSRNRSVHSGVSPSLTPDLMQHLVHLLANPLEGAPPALFTNAELTYISELAQSLPNRKLQGSRAKSRAEIKALPPEQIDVARGVLLLETEDSDSQWETIRSTEALLDLMALQILARLPRYPTPMQAVHEINQLLFDEMRFRFPPHSEWKAEIDEYTFLPAVLDSRHGVCLGISILYLALGQRLNLPLYAITPPGHIFVALDLPGNRVNIETTARGAVFPDDIYLSLSTRRLQKRDWKEVLGTAFINKASVYWGMGDHEKAKECYETANDFIENDALLTALRGFNAYLRDDPDLGLKLVKEAKAMDNIYIVGDDPLLDDLVSNNLGKEGLASIFSQVDEKRSSIEEKNQSLLNALTQWPKSKALQFHLAVNYLQLERKKEALDCMESYHSLDENNPTVEYMSSALIAERLNYPKAWERLEHAEALVADMEQVPPPLKELRQGLLIRSPRL